MEGWERSKWRDGGQVESPVEGQSSSVKARISFRIGADEWENFTGAVVGFGKGERRVRERIMPLVLHFGVSLKKAFSLSW
ncbi:hypothetical protein M8J76_005638 [Diaphorina citri]|nr:hypothetical protein M8J76_005638 [Diaphorina citri]